MRAEINGVAVVFLILIFGVLNFCSVSALESNASVETKANIEIASSCLDEMISRNIPINRANESLINGIQLYSSQKSLEERTKKANYKLANEYLLMVCSIKEGAFDASDELKVFLEFYDEISKTTELSSFEGSYQKILASFNEERFEETPSLINEGYKEMSEIQASQAAINAFYKAQIGIIKNFLIKNWKMILAVVTAGLLALYIFWRTIKRALLNSKINGLYARKKALNFLIKKIQSRYFEQGKISGFEYEIKLKRYKEMGLDIERQIPLIKEELAKLKEPAARKKETAVITKSLAPDMGRKKIRKNQKIKRTRSRKSKQTKKFK